MTQRPHAGIQDDIGPFDQPSPPIDAKRFLQSKKPVSNDGVVSRSKLDSLLPSIRQQPIAPG